MLDLFDANIKIAFISFVIIKVHVTLKIANIKSCYTDMPTKPSSEIFYHHTCHLTVQLLDREVRFFGICKTESDIFEILICQD